MKLHGNFSCGFAVYMCAQSTDWMNDQPSVTLLSRPPRKQCQPKRAKLPDCILLHCLMTLSRSFVHMMLSRRLAEKSTSHDMVCLRSFHFPCRG